LLKLGRGRLRSDSFHGRPEVSGTNGGGIEVEATLQPWMPYLKSWVLPPVSRGNCLNICDLRFFFFLKILLGSFGWEGGGPGITNGGIVG
jgi:hypothetical protein